MMKRRSKISIALPTMAQNSLAARVEPISPDFGRLGNGRQGGVDRPLPGCARKDIIVAGSAYFNGEPDKLCSRI
jgi:hypothetical protein